MHVLCCDKVKQVNEYEISGTLDKCKMLARNYPGAKLEDYALPTINYPDHIILHIGAKKLLTKKSNTNVPQYHRISIWPEIKFM